MIDDKPSYSAVKIGLLIAALSWFLFSLHELFKGTVNIGEYSYLSGPTSTWVLITDVSGFFGLITRTVAGALAVGAIVLYFGKSEKTPSGIKVLKWILVLEAVYWLSLLISGIWGLLPPSLAGFGNLGTAFYVRLLIETGIPCTVGAIAIPFVLFTLYGALGPGKLFRNAIRWGLIAGAIYVLVLWLENTGNWVYAVLVEGTEYLTAYPENLLSFLLTTVGMFALAIYAFYYAKKNGGTENFRQLNLKPAGAIVVLVGLYFLWNYLTWIFFGNNNLWSDWYAWFLGHNMDLWALALPFAGLPLLFEQATKKE